MGEYDELTRLRLACKRFQDAIICVSINHPGYFPNFPHKACGRTTAPLAAYLVDNQFGEFERVYGKRIRVIDGESTIDEHVWLEQDDLIVDITAHQYEEITEAIIIIPRDEAVFHAKYQITKRLGIDPNERVNNVWGYITQCLQSIP